MGMAAYALQTSNALTLPVPNILSALGLALPPLAGLALETSLSMTTAAARTKPDAQHIRPYVLQLVAAFFLIYEAVLATLAGSHLAPVAGLDCALRERWQHLFRTKDGPAIRAVQDRFDCCGLASPRDMAWPFPSAADGRGSDACLVRYDRTAACLGPWREAERRVAGLLLGVALGVFIWQVSNLAPTLSLTFIHSSPLPAQPLRATIVCESLPSRLTASHAGPLPLHRPRVDARLAAVHRPAALRRRRPRPRRHPAPHRVPRRRRPSRGR